jgi:hypothetical protein
MCPRLLVALAAALPTAAFADASLEGEPVYGESGVVFGNGSPFNNAVFVSQVSDSGVIGPGIEIVLSNPYQTFDFSDDGSTLTIHVDTGFAALGFNGFRFALTDPNAPEFIGFTIVSNTFPGFNASRVSLNGSRIALNFDGLGGVGDIVIALTNDGVELPEVEVVGGCPGPADLVFSNFTPGGRIALLRGTSLGTNAIPAGPCAGEVTDLNNLALQALFVADGDGEHVFSPNLPMAACGRWIQPLDVDTCTLGEPMMIP